MSITATLERTGEAALMQTSDLRCVPLADAKNKLSALTLEANRTGRPFVIVKSGLPWVEVKPLAVSVEYQSSSVHILPVKREVRVPDLDELFDGYEGSYRPREDGFAAPVGAEVL